MVNEINSSNADNAFDPRTATPVEYLHWLQLRIARELSNFGSRSSLSLNASLQDDIQRKAAFERASNLFSSSLNVAGQESEPLRSHYDEVKQHLLSIQVPTAADNPVGYSILHSVVRDVEQAIIRLGYKVPEEVTFGTLPTGQINGMACAVPAGGLIVALDDGLFTFLHSLAKTVATFYKATMNSNGLEISLVESDLAHAVITNEEGNLRWLETLVAAFVYKWPNVAPLRPITDDRQHLVHLLVNSVEIFIVAHEFGHLLLGHYERNAFASKRSLLSDIEVDRLNTLQKEELDADRLGLRFLREHHRKAGYSVDHTLAVIWFLGGCLLILEDMVGQDSNHPPALVRSKLLLQQLVDEEGSGMKDPSSSKVVFDVMHHLKFHNENRYRQWERQALNGKVPWM